MLLEHGAVVHPVELVAREDEHEAVARYDSRWTRFWRTASAVPWYQSVLVGALLRGQDLDESGREVVEPVALLDVPVQRPAVELGEQEDPAEVGVEAVADGDVDQAVLARERHRGLGAVLGQREEAGAGAAAHDDGDDVVRANGGPGHGYTSPKRSIGTWGPNVS